MNAVTLRTARLCALAAGTSLIAIAAAPAAAATDAPPPVRYQVDENGVDMARGMFYGTVTDLTIGPDGPGGLVLTRRIGSGVRTHNWDLGLFMNGSTWTASVGTRSFEFSASGTTYTSLDGSGATLVKVGSAWTLTAPDGTKIVYDYVQKDSLGTTARQASATSVTYPSGEKVTLTYKHIQFYIENDATGSFHHAVRLQSVTSTTGYMLHFDYAGETISHWTEADPFRQLTGVKAINLTADYCAPSNDDCSTAQAAPTVTYNGNDVTDALGRTSTYQSGSGYYAIRRPSQPVSDLVYYMGPNFKVTSVLRDGLTWTYAHSVSGSTATMTVTDPLNHTRTIVSNLNVGLPTAVTDEVGQTISYTYDTSGRLTRATMPEGDYVDYAYDGRGNVTSQTSVAKSGSGLANIVSSAAYPPTCTNVVTCNKPSSTTDPRGQTTDYTYDPTHGGLLTVTLPMAPSGVRPQTRYTYSAMQASYKNASGSLAASGVPAYRLTAVRTCQTGASCLNTADEVKTIVSYGANPGGGSNLLPTQTATGNGTGTLTAFVTTAWDLVGNVQTVNGPLAGTADTTRYRYDAARQLVATVSPDPDGGGAMKHRAMRTTYNLDGQPVKVEGGTTLGQTDAQIDAMAVLEVRDLVYDNAGRPTRETLTAGGAVQARTDYSYDGEGRLRCTALRMNLASSAEACSPGTDLNQPDRVSRLTYDAADRVLTVEEGVGTGNAAVVRSTSYTANGRVLTVTDGENNRTTYAYDGHDRLLKTEFPVATKGANASNPADYEQLTYDAAGSVVTRRVRDGALIHYTYDNLGRLVAKDLPNALTYETDTTYAYDLLGRMTHASTPYVPTTFEYDALGRKVKEGDVHHGHKTFEYDIAGRRTKMTWKDGLDIFYDYTVTGEMTRIREEGATSGVGVLATYAYDDRGRRTTLTRGNGTSTSYTYDAASRLASLTQNLAGTAHDVTLGFGYNPAGQIVTGTRSNDAYAWTRHSNFSRGYVSNGRNQYTQSGAMAYSYDAKGNLTSDGTIGYHYTVENRLAMTTGGAVTLAYDAVGRLYWMNVASSYGYDGSALTEELQSVGGFPFLRRYVHGPGVDDPVVWYEGSDTSDRRWLHADERGSIVAVTGSTGNTIAINTYDEYGVPGATNIGRFQYTGQTWLPELGLYNYKARLYSPTMGRFFQTDPIGYGDGMNLYAYVGADPVSRVDPSGTAEIVVTGGPRNASIGFNSAISGVMGDLSGLSSPIGANAIINEARAIMDRIERIMSRKKKEDNQNLPACGSPGADPTNCTIVVTGTRTVVAPSLDPYTLFNHWVNGSGETVCLTSQQFRKVVDTGKIAPAPKGADRTSISFYDTSLENSFGAATLHLKDGRPVGFFDNYDMGRATHRSRAAENKTTFGRIIGGALRADDFEIRYPC